MWGRKVWIIIIIKLFIMFAILKLFFFPDFLQKNYDNDKQRSEYVLDQLINSPVNYDFTLVPATLLVDNSFTAGEPACFPDVCTGRTINDLFTSEKRSSENDDS